MGELLEQKGVKVFNSSSVTRIANNKGITYEFLKDVVPFLAVKYGNEIAKDTFMVPVWVYWLILAACPLAFIIIGTQLMALAWRACGKTIADQQWTKVVFWILTAAIILWIAAVTVDCIRYEYARWLYKEAVKNLSEDESLMFSFTSRIWGIGFHIYGFYKWLWVLGWGACGMALAILWPEKKQQTL